MPATVNVCVYCASSEGVSDALRALARRTGHAIAERGWQVVYGGGDIGLMGELSRAAMAAGGRVFGVIPRRLMSREVAAPDISELAIVDTMRQRKQLMDERADAFLVLPGGLGTLEEFMEIITLRHLGYHDRPVVLLDTDDFWAPLLQLFRDMVSAGMAAERVHRLFEVATNVDDALDLVAAALSPAGPGSAESAHAVDPGQPGDGEHWDEAFGS